MCLVWMMWLGCEHTVLGEGDEAYMSGGGDAYNLTTVISPGEWERDSVTIRITLDL